MSKNKSTKIISPNEEIIVDKIANGYSNEAISTDFNIPIEEVQEIIKSPRVQAEIQKASQEVLKQFGSKESIKNAMKRIIMADLTDFYDSQGQMKPFDQIPQYLRQCITELEFKHGQDALGMPVTNVRIKTISKEKAIEVLARMEGLFKENDTPEEQEFNIGFE